MKWTHEVPTMGNRQYWRRLLSNGHWILPRIVDVGFSGNYCWVSGAECHEDILGPSPGIQWSDTPIPEPEESE